MGPHSVWLALVVSVLAAVHAVGCDSSEEPPCPDGFVLIPFGSSGDSLCEGCPDGSPAPTCVPQAGECEDDGGSGETVTYVVTVLRLAIPEPEGEPGPVAGFDMDGRVSDDDDVYGCFHGDFVSTDPDREEGVDNQLGSAFASSPALTALAAEGIADGTRLLLVTIDRVDDFVDDPCVLVTIERATFEGSGSPEIDAAGRIAPDQVFQAEDSTPWVDAAPAAINGGRLELGPLATPIPLDVGFAMFPVHEARLRLDPSPSGFTAGVLGAAIDNEDAAMFFEMFFDEWGASIAEGQADLHLDEEDLSCGAVSSGFELEGVEAIRTTDP